jgi:hypothetical protein
MSRARREFPGQPLHLVVCLAEAFLQDVSGETARQDADRVAGRVVGQAIFANVSGETLKIRPCRTWF